MTCSTVCTSKTLGSYDGAANADALFAAVYEDLCRLARHEVWRGDARDHLSTGTLVHEAWLDMSRSPNLTFDKPAQFLAYLARMMRGLVIDRVRARTAKKRGGDFEITSLDTHTADQVEQPEVLESVGDALDRLAELEPGLAQVVELKFLRRLFVRRDRRDAGRYRAYRATPLGEGPTASSSRAVVTRRLGLSSAGRSIFGLLIASAESE